MVRPILRGTVPANVYILGAKFLQFFAPGLEMILDYKVWALDFCVCVCVCKLFAIIIKQIYRTKNVLLLLKYICVHHKSDGFFFDLLSLSQYLRNFSRA